MATRGSYLSLLGLSGTATMAEVQERHATIAAFLSSAAVPRALRGWAAVQTALLDEHYAGALAGDQAESDKDAAPGWRPAQAARARSGEPRAASLLRFIRKPVFLLPAALVAAAAIVVVARMGDGDSGNANGASSDAAENAPVPLDTGQVTQWMAQVQQDPTNTTALFNLGEAFFQAQQWQSSIDWFTRLVAVDGKNVHARADIGTSRFNLGDQAGAKEAWLAALEIAPDDAQLHYNLGFLYLNSDPPDYAAARKEWQTVVDKAPGSSLAQTVSVHLSSLPAN